MLKIYHEYKALGVDSYYKQKSETYYNPHYTTIEYIYTTYITHLINNNDIILDIACGDGLISRLINKHNNTQHTTIIVEGTDPYFNNKYVTYKYSFEDIAKGNIPLLNNYYNVVICCYAFHLLNTSWYYMFLEHLAQITNIFIIITPSKKIIINHPRWHIHTYTRDNKITLIILHKHKHIHKHIHT